MANLEKHKKNLVSEWLEAEESTVPTQSRSTRILGSYIKIQKPISRKFRQNLPDRKPQKPDVSLLREPAPPPKQTAKSSQLASWEHQRKLERLPKLRAPYQYKNR
jgi:hypothetical protein